MALRVAVVQSSVQYAVDEGASDVGGDPDQAAEEGCYTISLGKHADEAGPGSSASSAPSAPSHAALNVQYAPSTSKRSATQSLSASVWSVSSKSVQQVFAQLVLPIGYPQSVAPGYWEYQIYDSLQGLCSYLRGVVSTSAVLQATGVGNANAHALSAAMTWAARDGLGMVGGLCFSYLCSPLFDMYVKEFRFFADCINNVGLALDMIAPYFASSTAIFLVLSLSTICKTMCGMSAGATKGRITQHFAVNGNMADLTAKESTQETLVSLIGMIGGMTLASWLHVEGDAQDLRWTMEFWTWLIFTVLTMLHVWSNYRGVTLLNLDTLNRERTKQAMLPLVGVLAKASGDSTSQQPKTALGPISSLIVPAKHLSESLASSTWDMMVPNIRLSDKFDPANFEADLMIRMQDATASKNPPDSNAAAKQFSSHSRNYLLGYNPRRGSMQIMLLLGASREDQLRSYLHALLIVHQHSQQLKGEARLSEAVLFRTSQALDLLFGGKDTSPRLLSDALESRGWDVKGRLYLGFASAPTVLQLSQANSSLPKISPGAGESSSVTKKDD